jgi:ribosomal protein S18 acetylase RimI-like enzyme
MPAMDLRLIETGSAAHRAELDLRYRVLRAPLGMPEGSEWYEHEEDCLHLVAGDGERVVACVVFHPTAPRSGRLLQMAVDEPYQAAGLGRRLVRRLETELAARGFTEVYLHARDHAIGFYERLGYRAEGEPYTEVGILHLTMRRRLDGVPEG